jgi:hypothetical protein
VTQPNNRATYCSTFQFSWGCGSSPRKSAARQPGTQPGAPTG